MSWEVALAICGALFGLFAESETEFTEETAILTCESNEIGVFHFENVPFGRWIVREIKAAPAFVLNENSYAVTVKHDEKGVYLRTFGWRCQTAEQISNHVLSTY